MSETKIIDRRASKKGPALELLHGTGDGSEILSGTLPSPLISLIEAERVFEHPVPIFDYILVKQGEKETTWGDVKIIIPEAIQKSPNQGAVVATAEFYIVEGEKFPMAELVKPGDLVTFSRYNVEDIERDGEKFVLCKIFDVKLIDRVSFGLGVSNASGL